MAYDFLDADPHPQGPAAELREFLKEYRESQSTPSEPPQEASKEPFTSRARDTFRSRFKGFKGLRKAPKISHALGWQPGQPGKALVGGDGQVHTWNVDSQYRPDHTEYAQQHGVQDHPGFLDKDDRPNYYPQIVINPGGDIHPATATSMHDLSPYYQADPRIKPPVVESGHRTLDQLDDIDWSQVS